jgi:hypothetical protein
MPIAVTNKKIVCFSSAPSILNGAVSSGLDQRIERATMAITNKRQRAMSDASRIHIRIRIRNWRRAVPITAVFAIGVAIRAVSIIAYLQSATP